MFSSCVNLKNNDLTSFNIKSVKYFINIFSDCTNLRTLKMRKELLKKLENN